ncbi:DUF4407 domain-containing protein [Reichenbachiella carrageenanivorans]|uniref:DUF4407 domain-containing protein n=1 Tax=Reichenbachiella carrageenanivorans TaxID=2979869 RepID=A0ABY6DAN8_9BACT|nr:DUF4407 domain-containing protein [Reichenbachiella carrageenanivorans]UXX80915.1 DUF4407 domain-containing protein [Reichenbachiella carrageenanivorans]
MKKIERFFCYCAGASQSMLNRCPTDTSKFVGIGASVFFTGLLAAISSAYALYFVFDHLLLSISFGLIWGLMIFNLDRFIVLSIRKSTGRTYLQAIPRLLLASLIALVISKPLELKIFEKEISTELTLIKQELIAKHEQVVNARFSTSLDSLNQILQALDLSITTKTAERNQLLDLARQEADGTGGSGKVNPGPIYQIKKANADLAQKELDELKSSNKVTRGNILAQVHSLEKNRQEALSHLEIGEINGISFQLTALNRLGEKYDTIYYANIFIIMLFLMLETAPILAKILSPRGPYDDLLTIHEKHFENYRKEKIYKGNQRLAKHLSPQAT